MQAASGAGNFLSRNLTPECGTLARSIKASSAVVIVIILIAFVLLTTAVVYNYVKQIKDDDKDRQINQDKKAKLVGGMTIASMVMLGIALLSSIWQYTAVSRTAKACLPA